MYGVLPEGSKQSKEKNKFYNKVSLNTITTKC